MKSRLTLAELSVLKKFASFLTACGNDELNVAVVSARNIPKARLTQRESEVLAQIAVGFKNGEIAPKLGVS
ncbi:MAG: LuxR C-terminal-related transcriptional regulator, partial [Candidatus Taylorbacteria bacterium]